MKVEELLSRAGVKRTMERIPVDRVDLGDETFRFTSAEIPQELEASIKRLGILNPPVVQKVTGGYRVVTGWKRVELISTMKWIDFEAIVFPEELQVLAGFAFAVAETAIERRLNPVEIARIIHKLETVFGYDDESIYGFLSSLTVEVPARWYGLYKSVLELAPELRKLVEDGVISVDMLPPVMARSPGDQLALARLFGELPFSYQQRRRVINLLDGIGKRDGVCWSEIISRARSELPSRMAPGRAAGVLIGLLDELMNPRLRAAERRFAEGARRLGWPGNVTIYPPVGFEGPTYRVEISFASEKRLEESARAVMESAGRGDISRLMRYALLGE